LTCFAIGTIVGLITWKGASMCIGESTFTKGLSFIATGLTMMSIDLTYRFVKNRSQGMMRWVRSTAGGWFLLAPLWANAAVLIWVGIQFLFVDD
jgi:hypothetical protein